MNFLGGFISGLIVSLIVIYASFYIAENRCAKKNNVYSCEHVSYWKPK
jgi:hypothetical protein